MSKRRLLTGLLVLAMCGTALAADPTLSESEKRFVEGLGIARQQIETLSAQDQAGLKQLIGPLIKQSSPAVRSYLATRNYIAKAKTNPKLQPPPEFDARYLSDAEKALLAPPTPCTLSEQECKVIEGLGIPHSDSMVGGLTPQEQAQFKQIIKDKPAAEVKSYLVTRYFMRVVKTNKRSLPKLDAAEEATIQKNFDINYCSDFNEQLDAMNALLYYGIEPARGTELKNSK